MPIIELICPGIPQPEAMAALRDGDAVIDSMPLTYRITVERDDGIACSEMEARTAMSMFCFESLNHDKGKPRPKSKKTALQQERASRLKGGA